ncbi:MAG: tetratricopeptide repeat protein [Coriobacteriia bacterium]|nr:tetratricopeptide repeat protein [Coriobacteriia bacterium]
MTRARTNGAPGGSRRVPLRLTVGFATLLVANIAIWSVLAYDWSTAVRYSGPGQEEIDVRREAVRGAPRDPGALLALAYAYQQAGRYDDALFTYDAVLEVLPVETAALYNRGVILFELGEDAAAAESLHSALEVNPGHVLSAAALGRHYIERGEYESVLDVVLPALDRRSGDADLHYLAGIAYERTGDLEQAEERYRLALAYYPEMREASDALARLGATP